MAKLSIAEDDIRQVTGLKGFKLLSHQRRKRSIIELICKAFPVGNSILDVGCASGDISVELSSVGYRVHGIDLEPIRLNQAKRLAKKYDQAIRFENNSFEELQSQRPYDGVLLGEVLEHFIDPVNTLRKIKWLLKPGGRVLITTPNMPSLRNRLKFGLLGIFPDNNLEHKYYFDYRRLLDVVEEAGFELVHFSTRYTNLASKSELLARIENVLLFWFSCLFRKSGDSIFALISPKPNSLSRQSHQK